GLLVADLHRHRGAAVAEALGISSAEALAEAADRHAVLRPPRARQAGLDAAEVQLDNVGEARLGRSLAAIQALLLGVALDQVDQLRRPAAQAQVADGLIVHREQRRR